MIVFTYILSPIAVLAETTEIQDDSARLGIMAPAENPAETEPDKPGTDITDKSANPDETGAETDEPNMPETNSSPGISPLAIDEPIEVTRAMIDDMSPYFFRIGDSIVEELLSQLETQAYVFSGYTSRGLFEIDWQINDIDFTTPGRYTITGKVLLTEEYVYTGGDLTVTSVIFVSDGSNTSAILITSCFYSVLNAPVILPLGASTAEVEAAFESVMIDIAICFTEYGDFFTTPVSLDISVIDTNTTGIYYPITVDLPAGCTFGGQEFWMLATHVVPTDEISLKAVSFWDAGYVVQWPYTATEQKLWVSVDGDIFEEGGKYADKMYGYFITMEESGLNGLYIPYTNLTPGHVYKFVVQYDDDRLSDALELDFTTSDIPKASNENGGDRTGIDRSKNVQLPDNGHPTTPPPHSSDDGDSTTPPKGQHTDDQRAALPEDDTQSAAINTNPPDFTQLAVETVAPADTKTPAEETTSANVVMASNSMPQTGLSAAMPANETPAAANNEDEGTPTTAEETSDTENTFASAHTQNYPETSLTHPPSSVPLTLQQTADNPPYKDNALRVALACGAGLCGVAAYAGISLKRRGKK